MIVSSGSVLRCPLVLGALLVLLAVMAGAFGAHALRAIVSERSLEVFQTGVQYQMIHGLGLILIAILGALDLSRRLLVLAAGFLAAGVVMFSGSLYLLVLTEMRWLGPVTPLGGLCFMAGWVLVVIAGLRQGKGKESL